MSEIISVKIGNHLSGCVNAGHGTLHRAPCQPDFVSRKLTVFRAASGNPLDPCNQSFVISVQAGSPLSTGLPCSSLNTPPQSSEVSQNSGLHAGQSGVSSTTAAPGSQSSRGVLPERPHLQHFMPIGGSGTSSAQSPGSRAVLRYSAIKLSESLIDPCALTVFFPLWLKTSRGQAAKSLQQRQDPYSPGPSNAR